MYKHYLQSCSLRNNEQGKTTMTMTRIVPIDIYSKSD